MRGKKYAAKVKRCTAEVAWSSEKSRKSVLQKHTEYDERIIFIRQVLKKGSVQQKPSEKEWRNEGSQVDGENRS